MAKKELKPFKTPDAGVFNLRAGALCSPDNVLILAGLKRLDAEHTAHSVVLKWNGGDPWLGVSLGWSSASCCVIPGDECEYCMVGLDGEVGVLVDRELIEIESIESSMSAVADIGAGLYAVGVVGRVFASKDGRSWGRIKSAEEANDKLLEASAAFSVDEVYAVGSDGAIVRLGEGRAERKECPTNLVLSGVCRGPDDLMYVCGQRGMILRGREDEWRVIDHGLTTEDFWDICVFQGRIFVASTRFLYELTGDELRPVDFDIDTPFTFCKLATFGNDALLSVGQSDALLFDGRDWKRLI